MLLIKEAPLIMLSPSLSHQSLRAARRARRDGAAFVRPLALTGSVRPGHRGQTSWSQNGLRPLSCCSGNRGPAATP